nr:hypothetical protein [uncultured Fluviicola sp.]
MATEKITYEELVLGNTISIHNCQEQGIEPFKWLFELITQGKKPLKENTIDYIVLKVLNQNLRIYKFDKKPSFDVYVIGTFTTYFNPTFKVSQAFAEFYLEMGVLPNIISVPKKQLMQNTREYSNKLRNGILLYERR